MLQEQLLLIDKLSSLGQIVGIFVSFLGIRMLQELMQVFLLMKVQVEI